MPACTAYELTLIIELLLLERSNKETAKIVILCVHACLYMCTLAFPWFANKSTHYMRFKHMLVNSDYFIKIFRCVIRWNELEK